MSVPRAIALLLATIVCVSHGLDSSLASNVGAKASWQDVVKIQSGYIHGRITGFNTREFLGIPFAAPPLGSLRWQPPAPVQPWGEKIVDASVLKPACAQLPDQYSSEDCLYLNVYAPLQPHDPISPFPVMVFIHGGSYTDGSAKVDTYNATRMVAANGNVIVVTIQYRLNAFGFLGSQSLLGSDSSTGNWGLQDQRYALQWVRNNIAAFYGDPTNITAFGESAGSGSISAHLVMPHSSGIFDRVILESGPFSNWIAKPLWQANNTFVQLATYLGCVHDAVTCLRSKSTQDLLKGVAYLAANPPADANEIRWSAVIDGVELWDHPKVLAKQGKFSNSVPVMLGVNHDEGTIFLQNAIPRNISEVEYSFILTRYFGVNATDVLNMYPPAQYQNAWWALSHAYGDAAFNCPARRSARWLAAVVPSVHFYYFTHAPTFPPIASMDIGAFHSAELMFVFRDPNMLYGQQEYTLADSMIGYWTQFAHKSDPNHANAVEWPQYLLETDENIVLDLTISSQTGLKQSLCDFWDRTSF